MKTSGIQPFTKDFDIPEYFVMEIKSKGLLLREEWDFKISKNKFEEILEKQY